MLHLTHGANGATNCLSQKENNVYASARLDVYVNAFVRCVYVRLSERGLSCFLRDMMTSQMTCCVYLKLLASRDRAATAAAAADDDDNDKDDNVMCT